MSSPSQPDPLNAMVMGEQCNPLQLAEFSYYVRDILAYSDVREYRKAQFLGATGTVELVSITSSAIDPAEVIRVSDGDDTPLNLRLVGEKPTELMIDERFAKDRGSLLRSVGKVVEGVIFNEANNFDPQEWRIFEHIINVAGLLGDVELEGEVDIPDEVCADLSYGVQYLTRRRLPISVAIQEDNEQLDDGRVLTIRSYEYSDGTQVEAGGVIAPYLHLEIAKPALDPEEEPTVIEVLNVWKDGVLEHIRRGQGVDLSKIGLRKKFEVTRVSDSFGLNRTIDTENLAEINHQLLDWALRKDLEAGFDPRST